MLPGCLHGHWLVTFNDETDRKIDIVYHHRRQRCENFTYKDHWKGSRWETASKKQLLKHIKAKKGSKWAEKEARRRPCHVPEPFRHSRASQYIPRATLDMKSKDRTAGKGWKQVYRDELVITEGEEAGEEETKKDIAKAKKEQSQKDKAMFKIWKAEEAKKNMAKTQDVDKQPQKKNENFETCKAEEGKNGDRSITSNESGSAESSCDSGSLFASENLPVSEESFTSTDSKASGASETPTVISELRESEEPTISISITHSPCPPSQYIFRNIVGNHSITVRITISSHHLTNRLDEVETDPYKLNASPRSSSTSIKPLNLPQPSEFESPNEPEQSNESEN